MSSSDAVPALHYEHVSKAFHDLTVVDDLSMDVQQGERVALIGPSGSGKTTLLRMAIALESPTSGNVSAFGMSYWQPKLGRRATQRRLREVRRQVGIVFQSYNLFPHMTVLQNLLEAPSSLMGVSDKDAERRAYDLLERVGLREKAKVHPRHLSGGQKQRAAIARALMLQPRLLLLDEITSALDPELVGEVLNVIKSVAAESDVAMLIVTHEMGFAKDVADRVCLLDSGRIVEEGSPTQIFEAPKNQRTKDFLGLIAAAS